MLNMTLISLTPFRKVISHFEHFFSSFIVFYMMFCLRVIIVFTCHEIYFTVEEVDFCGYRRSVTRHLTEGVVIVFM